MDEENIRIYLTDQLVGRPNVRTMSKEIMLTVANFYKKPVKADGFRKDTFTDWHRPAWDSGGFQFLMGKLKDPDPRKTIDLYKRIGVTAKDLPIQLDLPPPLRPTPRGSTGFNLLFSCVLLANGVRDPLHHSGRPWMDLFGIAEKSGLN